jgi:dTDP-4-dehydrorhamnose 3,5-epimerase-like enzyme
LSTIPESDAPTCHHRDMKPKNHPWYQPNVLRASHLQLKTKSENEQMTQHWGLSQRCETSVGPFPQK